MYDTGSPSARRGAHEPGVDVIQEAEEGRAVAQVILLDVGAGPQATGLRPESSSQDGKASHDVARAPRACNSVTSLPTPA